MNNVRYKAQLRLCNIVLAIICILVVAAACEGVDESPSPTSTSHPYAGLTPDPAHHTFTLVWSPGGGLQDLQIAITPTIPPQSLDLYPSSYVKVTAKIKGKVVFKTDDPYYQCFESLAVASTILLFEEEIPLAGVLTRVFIAAYRKCGPLLTQGLRSSSPLAMVYSPAILHDDRSNYVVLFQVTGTPSEVEDNGDEVDFPDAQVESGDDND